MPDFSQRDILAFVVATGFAAGLNVYATGFSLGMMARLHWIELPVGLDLLASTWILSASGCLFAVEVFADKLPGFDLIWNALHTFVRIPIAALMAYAAGSQLSPEARILATCLGAAFAAIAHGLKTAARVAVTPSPEPISNISLSTAEDAGAVGLSWIAVHHPVAGAATVGVLTVAGVALMWWGWRLLKAVAAKVFRRGIQAPGL
jgi:hypothetical protein